MFDFVANILANISSLKEGRCWMIENPKDTLNPVFLLAQSTDTNKHRFKHLVDTVRNICFEYEKYALDFLQLNVIEILCRLLVKEHGLTENSLPQSWQHLKGLAEKEIFASQIDMANTRELLDSLMLCANSKELLEHMSKLKIYELFEVLKVKPFGECRDKIDVVNAQIMELSQPPL